MFSHIYSTTIFVDDQDAAIDFYVNTLGWEKTMDVQMGPEMRFVTVAPQGATTQLVIGLPSWIGETSNSRKNTGISLITPDIDATYATLVERGVTFKEPVSMMPWGAKATWFYDLEGNEFFLAEG
ncbi:MAG TPA: VOC family protein [Nitrolancea sp.]|nr:VOC family protein [Nitrolancea sp.]